MEFNPNFVDIYYNIIKAGGPTISMLLSRLNCSWKAYMYRFIDLDIKSSIIRHDIFSLSKHKNWPNEINAVHVSGNGNLSIIKHYIAHASEVNRVGLCVGIGLNGNPEIIEYLKISSSAEWSHVLYGAYLADNVTLFNIALDKGADNFTNLSTHWADYNYTNQLLVLIKRYPESINSIIYGLCISYNTESALPILDYLVSINKEFMVTMAIILYYINDNHEAADMIYHKYGINDINIAFSICVDLNSVQAIEYLCHYGYVINKFLLRDIGIRGEIDMVYWSSNNSLDICDYYITFKEIIKNRRFDILDQMINSQIVGTSCTAMYFAGRYGITDICDYIVNKDENHWKYCLYGACVSINADMIQYITNHTKSNSIIVYAIMNIIKCGLSDNIPGIISAFHNASIRVQVELLDKVNIYIG